MPIIGRGVKGEGTYHFEIISGGEVAERGSLTTAPSLESLPASDTVYGQLFWADGSTPAANMLVYLTLQDADGLGSQGKAAPLSVLTAQNGYWYANLGNARLADGSPFSYAQSDVVVLTIPSDTDNSITTLDTSDLDPAPPIHLNEGPKSWRLYLPLIDN